MNWENSGVNYSWKMYQEMNYKTMICDLHTEEAWEWLWWWPAWKPNLWSTIALFDSYVIKVTLDVLEINQEHVCSWQTLLSVQPGVSNMKGWISTVWSAIGKETTAKKSNFPYCFNLPEDQKLGTLQKIHNLELVTLEWTLICMYFSYKSII